MSSAPLDLTCEICYKAYNMQTRIPKFLPCCGKTICRKCLETLLRNIESSCPWCRSKFNMNCYGYKTNIQLLEIVQEDSQWAKCPRHNENMKLVCRHDRQKLCPYCAIGSECKKHELTHLLSLKPTSDQRLSELKGHLSQADEKMRQYDKVISQNRNIFQNVIRENFDQQIYELQKAKAKILMKFNSILSNKQAEVNNAFGQNSSLRMDFEAKIDNHKNFLKAERPLSVIEEDLSVLKQRVELFINEGQGVLRSEQQLLDLAPLVHKRLDHIFGGLKREDFKEVIDQGGVEIPVIEGELGNIEKLSFQVLGLSVRFGTKDNDKIVLYFLEKKWGPFENIKLDYGQVKENERIMIDLQGIQWNEFNLKALELVLSAQTKTNEVHFGSVQHPLGQEMEIMSRLFSIVFKRPQDIKELTFHLLADDNFVMLLNAVLPQLSSLKRLKVRSVAQGISRENLNDFAENLLLLAPNLEDLSLNLSDSDFPVKSLSISMPKLKKFNLNVCRIVDFGDMLFTKVVQNVMPQVEDFHIDVSETSVTPSCLKAMKEKIRHFPTFSISNRMRINYASSKIQELDDLFG